MRPVCKGPFGEKWLTQLNRKELMEWAVNVKPGDLFNGCDGYNHVVKSMEYDYVLPQMETDEETGEVYGPCHGGCLQEEDLERHENWVLNEVGFHTEDGLYFVCPGGGCAVPAWTVEEIRKEFPKLKCDERGLKIQTAK